MRDRGRRDQQPLEPSRSRTRPIKRVLAINRETSERKLDHDADVLYRLGAHPFVAHWGMSPHVFTFNVSNVPGPAHDIYVLGAHIREVLACRNRPPARAESGGHFGRRLAVLRSGRRGRINPSSCVEVTTACRAVPAPSAIRRSLVEKRPV